MYATWNLGVDASQFENTTGGMTCNVFPASGTPRNCAVVPMIRKDLTAPSPRRSPIPAPSGCARATIGRRGVPLDLCNTSDTTYDGVDHVTALAQSAWGLWLVSVRSAPSGRWDSN